MMKQYLRINIKSIYKMKNVITTLVIGFLSFAVAPPPAPAPSKLSQEGEICGGFKISENGN